jgi:hypothetical protein
VPEERERRETGGAQQGAGENRRGSALLRVGVGMAAVHTARAAVGTPGYAGTGKAEDGGGEQGGSQARAPGAGPLETGPWSCAPELRPRNRPQPQSQNRNDSVAMSGAAHRPDLQQQPACAAPKPLYGERHLGVPGFTDLAEMQLRTR